MPRPAGDDFDATPSFARIAAAVAPTPQRMARPITAAALHHYTLTGVALVTTRGAELPPLASIRAACMALRLSDTECSCQPAHACRPAIGAAALAGGRA